MTELTNEELIMALTATLPTEGIFGDLKTELIRRLIAAYELGSKVAALAGPLAGQGRIAQLEAALREAIVCPSCLGEGEVTAECEYCLSGEPGTCQCEPMTCPQCDGKKWDAPEKAIPLIEALLPAPPTGDAPTEKK